jgi:hypothetical protein
MSGQQSTLSERRKSPLRMVRPSLLDQRFTGDSWIVEQGDGSYSICLGDYRLTGIQTIGFDVPSMNNVIERMRHPRHRRRAV